MSDLRTIFFYLVFFVCGFLASNIFREWKEKRNRYTPSKDPRFRNRYICKCCGHTWEEREFFLGNFSCPKCRSFSFEVYCDGKREKALENSPEIVEASVENREFEIEAAIFKMEDEVYPARADKEYQRKAAEKVVDLEEKVRELELYLHHAEHEERLRTEQGEPKSKKKLQPPKPLEYEA